MDPERDAADMAQALRDLAFERLRKEYPFFKSEALDTMLGVLQKSTCAMIEAHQPAMATSRAAFSFFSIPAELRNRIYDLALVDDKQRQDPYEPTLEVNIYKDHREYCPQANFRWPALLCVNKQIRSEALPIWLAQTTFVAPFEYMLPMSPEQKKPLHEWLKMLGTERTRYIKTLALRCEFWDVGLVGTGIKQSILDRFQLDSYGVSPKAYKVQRGCLLGGLQEVADDGTVKVLKNDPELSLL